MLEYSRLDSDKLLALVEKDDPEALYEYAGRLKNDGDETNAVRYYTLAAQLFHADSNFELGNYHSEKGNVNKALEHYRTAYESGSGKAALKLANALMDSDETAALEILITGAVSGNTECIETLEKYYSEKGDDEESAFWHEKL